MMMPTEDRLLKIDEAAQVLGTSEDWLYHNWKKLPFAFKWSPRQLRFSLKGLHRYTYCMSRGNFRGGIHLRVR
jgi:predicted DNA-binding transcriptional regulator AlpA